MRNALTVLLVLLISTAACDGDDTRGNAEALSATPRIAVLGTCGNGVLEPDELCDPGIAAGVGACPSTCADLACSRDVLVHGGTCVAQCQHEPITAPANGDGCCPPGATADNDSDCPRCACDGACGDGRLDPGELCDTGIGVGDPGACPTVCPSDGQACTRDLVDQPATCQASCVYVAITTPANNDGCCPAGANALTDNDCPSICGNGVVEPGEACDDGNRDNADACDNTCRLPVAPTAYRFTSLELRDPHVFPPGGPLCIDLTSAVTSAIATSLTSDGNGDGFLDSSPTLLFRPLAQTGTSTPFSAHVARCTAPVGSTTCAAGGAPAVSTVADNGGPCLGIVPGTTRPYSPPVQTPTSPCFASRGESFWFPVLGVPVPLHSAQFAGTYSGNPASSVTSGLLRGFLFESDANQIVLPADMPFVGGRKLASILPGGNPGGSSERNCSTQSAKDMLNGVSGWWLYLNFQASRAPWTE